MVEAWQQQLEDEAPATASPQKVIHRKAEMNYRAVKSPSKTAGRYNRGSEQ